MAKRYGVATLSDIELADVNPLYNYMLLSHLQRAAQILLLHWQVLPIRLCTCHIQFVSGNIPGDRGSNVSRKVVSGGGPFADICR